VASFNDANVDVRQGSCEVFRIRDGESADHLTGLMAECLASPAAAEAVHDILWAVEHTSTPLMCFAETHPLTPRSGAPQPESCYLRPSLRARLTGRVALAQQPGSAQKSCFRMSMVRRQISLPYSVHLPVPQ